MDSGISKEEIRKTWNDLVALKKRIEEEWELGKRDMLRANILGVADDLQRMMAALHNDDVNAFRVAAQEANDHAKSLNFHSIAWLNRARAAKETEL